MTLDAALPPRATFRRQKRLVLGAQYDFAKGFTLTGVGPFSGAVVGCACFFHQSDIRFEKTKQNKQKNDTKTSHRKSNTVGVGGFASALRNVVAVVDDG